MDDERTPVPSEPSASTWVTPGHDTVDVGKPRRAPVLALVLGVVAAVLLVVAGVLAATGADARSDRDRAEDQVSELRGELDDLRAELGEADEARASAVAEKHAAQQRLDQCEGALELAQELFEANERYWNTEVGSAEEAEALDDMDRIFVLLERPLERCNVDPA